jgi:hypothetical protein
MKSMACKTFAPNWTNFAPAGSNYAPTYNQCVQTVRRSVAKFSP